MRSFSLLVSLMCLCSPCALADDSEMTVNPYDLVDFESEANMGIKTSYEASNHVASNHVASNHVASNHVASAPEAHSEFTSEEVEESECSENSTCP